MSQNSAKPGLGELVSKSAEITRVLIESGGELTPELEREMEHVDLAMADKMDACHFVAERLEREAEYFAEKAKRLQAIAIAHKKASDRIRARVKEAMLALGRTEVMGHEVRFTLVQGAPKLVIQESELPSEFKMQVMQSVPDKERIKEALQRGDRVLGACWEPSYQLRTYVNRSHRSKEVTSS
jgi:hypothetical protein